MGRERSVITPTEGPRKSVVRQRFDDEKDSVIESAIGKQESWAKKVGAGNSGVMLDDIEKLLHALGLKVVDRSKVCVDRRVFEAYKQIASTAMSEPEKLQWDE